MILLKSTYAKICAHNLILIPLTVKYELGSKKFRESFRGIFILGKFSN